jgi:single-strand DNA-binding protein
MAGETVITVVGNLTADPELRYTQNGLPVANFTIASTPRNFDRQANEWKDGEALFLRASVWREFAEHVAGSLTKGSRHRDRPVEAAFLPGPRGQQPHRDRAGGRRDRPLAAVCHGSGHARRVRRRQLRRRPAVAPAAGGSSGATRLCAPDA